MATILTTRPTNAAKEEGSFVITATFTDADGTAVTPTSLTWTLTNMDNEVINSRENVAVTGGDLGTSVNIVLSGDDLALEDRTNNEYESRIITLKAVYNSATYGNDLHIYADAQFSIDKLPGLEPST